MEDMITVIMLKDREPTPSSILGAIIITSPNLRTKPFGFIVGCPDCYLLGSLVIICLVKDEIVILYPFKGVSNQIFSHLLSDGVHVSLSSIRFSEEE